MGTLEKAMALCLGYQSGTKDGSRLVLIEEPNGQAQVVKKSAKAYTSSRSGCSVKSLASICVLPK